ncbi:hypothetical protein BaRGS_00009363 [Batillaria attramentaria]|uniref:Uncharacterized protein n=1 Tax=Batillaria attramentaria TaxID=370345 RepID=A0ABD0LIZ0_9CAEN
MGMNRQFSGMGPKVRGRRDKKGMAERRSKDHKTKIVLDSRSKSPQWQMGGVALQQRPMGSARGKTRGEIMRD